MEKASSYRQSPSHGFPDHNLGPGHLADLVDEPKASQLIACSTRIIERDMMQKELMSLATFRRYPRPVKELRFDFKGTCGPRVDADPFLRLSLQFSLSYNYKCLSSYAPWVQDTDS